MQTDEEEKTEIESALEQIVVKSDNSEMQPEIRERKEEKIIDEPMIAMNTDDYSRKEYWSRDDECEKENKYYSDSRIDEDKDYAPTKLEEEREYKLREETENEIKKRKFAHTFNLPIAEKSDKSLAEKSAKELHRIVNFTLNIVLYDLAQV